MKRFVSRSAKRVVFRILAGILSTLTLTPAQAGEIDRLWFEAQPLPGTHGHVAANASPGSAVAGTPARRTLNFSGLVPSLAESGKAAADAETIQTSIRAYTSSITTMEMDQGPYTAGLAQQYLALGQLYQQQAEHAKAIAEFAKAEHINRVNFGLNATEQFPAVELSIASYLAQQDFQQAIERQEYLVYLHQSRFGTNTVEIVPELIALGDMYFDAFERGVQRVPGGSGLQMNYGPQSGFVDPQDLSALDIAFLWLRQAQSYYHKSIVNLVDNQRYFDPRLLTLETSLIETLFLQAHRDDMATDTEFFMSARDLQTRDVLTFEKSVKKIPSYRDGEEAFTRILAYLQSNPAVAPEQVAEAMLELGDWHLLFGHPKAGKREYQRAQRYLEESGVSPEVIASVLAPTVPVQLPTFLEQPHSKALVAGDAAEDSDFAGYIDVSFRVNTIGRISDIEVLDKSPNADPAIEARLKKVLNNAPFRPRFDMAGTSDRVEVRYNFAQL